MSFSKTVKLAKLLTMSESPSFKIPGCAPDHMRWTEMLSQ